MAGGGSDKSVGKGQTWVYDAAAVSEVQREGSVVPHARLPACPSPGDRGLVGRDRCTLVLQGEMEPEEGLLTPH